MKARVKATGNIVDVKWYGHNTMGAIYADSTHSTKYYEYELDFDTVYDYWDKLKHQYVGMAIQGMLTRGEIKGISLNTFVGDAIDIADAAVEMLKKEE